MRKKNSATVNMSFTQIVVRANSVCVCVCVFVCDQVVLILLVGHEIKPSKDHLVFPGAKKTSFMLFWHLTVFLYIWLPFNSVEFHLKVTLLWNNMKRWVMQAQVIGETIEPLTRPGTVQAGLWGLVAIIPVRNFAFV